MKKIITLILTALFISSCSMQTENINMKNDKKIATKGLSYQDFQETADALIESLIRSGNLNKPGGGKYVMAVSRIVNDTMQNIDTSQLMKKIRVALLRSGKVQLSNSAGSNQDKLSEQLIKLRSHQQGNRIDSGLNANRNRIDLSLFGKIIQKNIAISSSKEQIEYYFQLTLSGRDGLSVWEDEYVLGKRADGSSVSW